MNKNATTWRIDFFFDAQRELPYRPSQKKELLVTETHSRLSDYLNRSGPFFHIDTASRDCFVASAFVKLIRPALS